MPDSDLSLGEVQRNMARHEREMEAIRTQVTTLARESVTVNQFTQEMSSLRRELATDRNAAEELARERHNSMIDRIDRLDKDTGDKFEKLEVKENQRPMNTWIKASIVGSLVIGVMGIVLTLLSQFMHHA